MRNNWILMSTLMPKGTQFCKLKYFPFCQYDAKRSELLFEYKIMPINSIHLFLINPAKNSLENHQCVKNKYIANEVCMYQISYTDKVTRSLWIWKCYSNIPDHENEPLHAVKRENLVHEDMNGSAFKFINV